jgi:hypothetical protein
MIQGHSVLQDLDEVLSSQLARSAAGGHERRQSDLVHVDLLTI